MALLRAAALLLALAAPASAFMNARVVPRAASRTAAAASPSALRMTFEDELGAQPPLGFYDPLGLLENADQDRFDRLREVELKHGQLCLSSPSSSCCSPFCF